MDLKYGETTIWSIQLSSFSISFLFVMISLPIVMAFVRPTASIIILLLYLPTILLYAFVSNKISREQLDFDLLIRLFVAGFFPGLLIAFACEIILTAIFAMFFMQEHNQEVISLLNHYYQIHPGTTETSGELVAHLQIKKTVGLFMFLISLSFIVASMVEEIVKFWAVRGKFCEQGFCGVKETKFARSPIFIILCMAAAGLGFATLESFGYAFLSSNFHEQLLSVARRNITITPLHVICASITGVGLVKHEVLGTISKVRALIPAILVHGIFNLQGVIVAMSIAPKVGPTSYIILSTFISFVFVLASGSYLHGIMDELDLPLLTTQWAKEQNVPNNEWIPEGVKFISDDDEDSLLQFV